MASGEILLGVSVGVAASLVAWLITLSVLRPKIAMSEDVSCIPWADGVGPLDGSWVRYRIKIENRSLRSAIDVRLNVRLAIKGAASNEWTILQFPEIEGDWLPRLAGRKIRSGRRPNRIVTIRLRRPRGLVELVPREIIQQFDDGQVVLEDLLSLGTVNETQLRVYVMCMDGFTGTPRVFLQRYTLQKVAYARFRAGSVKINPASAWLEPMRPSAG